MNVDYELGLAQLLSQAIIRTLQLLVLFGHRISFGFWTELSWLESLVNTGGSFTPPLSQMRRVQALAPQQRTDAAVLRRRVSLRQYLLLVGGREPPAFPFGHDFRVGTNDSGCLGADFAEEATDGT